MSEIRIDPKKITVERFNKIIHDNLDAILASTPHNPTISADDEWNDPIYDNYAQIDDIPGRRKHRNEN